MPDNSVPETKTGVEKSRFSLSLKRNNATYLIDGNNKIVDSKESSNLNKENKPVKRPFTGTYSNILSAAKRLKPLTEIHNSAGKI